MHAPTKATKRSIFNHFIALPALLVFPTLLATSLGGCADSRVSESEMGDDVGTGGTDGTTTDGAMDVSLSFRAQAGSEAVDCGSSIDGLGASDTTLEVLDFRFYVHDVVLISEDGDEVALNLTQDDPWQKDNIALLDFEAGGVGTVCTDSGNPETNGTVDGTVPEDSYSGVRFTVGVPFSDNHADAAIAPTPLNASGMFWNWNGGYKFVRIDMKDEDEGFRFHLGSTLCDGDAMGNVTECANENRFEVSIDDFDIENDTVIADLDKLLEDVDFTQNVSDPGCMSKPVDDDCELYFRNVGLPFGGEEAVEQRFFRKE